MNYQAKQQELDVKKWLASEKEGKDACGEFDYCAHCDKNEEFPCAVASEKAAAKAKSAKAAAPKAAVTTPKSATTTTAKKTGCKGDCGCAKAEAAATAAPKAAAPKTAAKKTTAKK